MRWRLIIPNAGRAGAVAVLSLAVLWWSGFIVPPRPMFHNDYCTHDDSRPPWPCWWPASSLADEQGHWAEADYQDNILAVVATGVPKMSLRGWTAGGLTETRVRVGDDQLDNFVTVPRLRDTLFVIVPDGHMEQFCLSPGLAERFHTERLSERVVNILREAGALLAKDERMRFHEFLRGYAEPVKTIDKAP